jgi:hypothetical protein
VAVGEIASGMSGDGLGELESDALRGPLGAWVSEAAAHTEADPAALLLSGLVAFGVAAGPDRFVLAANRPQRACLFVALVADSPKANRGLSWTVTRDLLGVIDPRLARLRVLRGLGNGRPLIEALAPRRSRWVDQRLLVFEPAFTRALALAARSSCPLTWALRNAWDGAPLERPSHGRRALLERHHIGVIGHGTIEQLRPQLNLADASASLVNRFVWVVVRRQRILPDEGNVPPELTLRHGRALAEAALAARGSERMLRTAVAERLWHEAYEELAEDDPDGLLGIAVARSARHVLRLALIYALAERCRQIGPAHLRAALALWRHSRRSAVRIFGGGGDELAARLLVALRRAGPRGMTLTEQAGLFSRNLPAERLERARGALERSGLAVTTAERRAGQGRPARVTRALGERPS